MKNILTTQKFLFPKAKSGITRGLHAHDNLTANIGWKGTTPALCVLAAIGLLAVGAGAAPGQAPAPRSPFADRPVNSYSGPGLTWGQAKLDDFGPVPVAFNTAGMRAVAPAPAPGVHPRVLFGPGELPDLRRRLKETRCGREAWKHILCWSHCLKGDFDPHADYAQPDLWKGWGGWVHGPAFLAQIGPGGPSGERFRKLVQGDSTAATDRLWPVLTLEAFRCLVDDDSAGARTLARAVITAMRIDQAKRDGELKQKGQIAPKTPVSGLGHDLAFCYDFIFNELDAAQKKEIHGELARGSWYHDNYGTFNDATTTRSNWATFTYWLYPLLAIEGEEGFNELKLRGLYRGFRNFCTYGVFSSGAYFEGEAKAQFATDGMTAFTRRMGLYGFDPLPAHPQVQKYFRDFLPHSLTPGCNGFACYDFLGGINNRRPLVIDVLAMKYLYPDDKTIDWVWRNVAGDDYQHLPTYSGGYANNVLLMAVFASDFDPANNDPAKLGLNPTFFCGQRALLMTRSGWDRDALMLAMHTRGCSGGHAYADRNSIQLAALGCVWATIDGWEGYPSGHNGEVTIDGHTQHLNSPGRVVDFQDRPEATFAVGDAKYAWDWNLESVSGGPYTRTAADAGQVPIPAGWEKEMHCFNDFAFTKLDRPQFTVPLFLLPHWIAPTGHIAGWLRQPNYPVRKAFRTAGLVRGKTPYVLIVDDIQKDEKVHHFDWTLPVEGDVNLLALHAPNKEEKHREVMDIVLSGRSPKLREDWQKAFLQASPIVPPSEDSLLADGEPLLLVRVLQMNCQPDEKSPMGRAYITVGGARRLVIPTDAVSPDFKVLIFPFRKGQSLPKTKWDEKFTTLTVETGGASDVFTFFPSPEGKSNFTLMRQQAGKQTALAKLTAPVPAIPNR